MFTKSSSQGLGCRDARTVALVSKADRECELRGLLVGDFTHQRNIAVNRLGKAPVYLSIVR